MPELPEVETIRRELEPLLVGQRLERVWSGEKPLRRPIPSDLEQQLRQCKVYQLSRRGKYLLMYFTGEPAGYKVLLIHLGMSGRLLFTEHKPQLQRHDHLLLGFGTSACEARVYEAKASEALASETGGWIVLNDPRRFGCVELISLPTGLPACRPACPTVSERQMEEHSVSSDLLNQLGPEPLSGTFTADVLAQRLKRRPKSTIKSALLDSSVVAGIGNIYACEILYHARLHPRCLTSALLPGQIELLTTAIRQVLSAAIEAGGSSWRDYTRPSGLMGSFQQQFAVYGRQGQACPGCDCEPARSGGIVRERQSQRSTFYCPRRQSVS